MSNLYVFSTGSNLDLLKESCQYQGITLHTFDAKWTGYVDVKVRAAIYYLTTVLPYAKEDAVMWVDGNDSLILKPEHDILSRWMAMGMPLLISAERTCWPDPDKANRYPAAPEPRFLNAGGYLGTRQDVMFALHTVLRHSSSQDDQRAWTDVYLAGLLPQLQIDHSRSVFSCAADGEAAIKADTCCLHFNGRTPGRQELWDELRNPKTKG